MLRTLLFTCLLLTASSVFAKTSIGLDFGAGGPDDLRGARAAVQDYWAEPWTMSSQLQMQGYWDYSLAYWGTHDHLQPGERDSIIIIALAPVFRIQTKNDAGIRPYVEASIGGAWMNHDKIGHRDLGAKFAFQDLLGFGLVFGKKQQFDVSYHLLHYSNAGIFAPNQGIDVNYLLSFKYVIQ